MRQPASSPPRFLVCAGSTREAIDQVRDWGNIFTGGTGFTLAQALAAYGPVDLLTSNLAHAAQVAAGSGVQHAMRTYTFRSHADLVAAVDARMAADAYAGVCMSAAVSDYTPDGCFSVIERTAAPDGSERWLVRDVQAGKVSSTHAELAILGRPTAKVVDRFRAIHRFAGVLVKFKLEVGLASDRLIAVGETSRLASGADLLVANTLAMVEGHDAGAWLLGDGAPRWTPRRELATQVAALVATRCGLEPLPAAAGAPELTRLVAQHCLVLADVIGQVPAAAYVERPGRSSIGEHVRHGLDHLRAIVHRHGPIVDYECRRRGWAGERDAALALAELHELASDVVLLTTHDLAQPVVVRCCADPAAPPLELPSTLGRELLFGISHEVHHAAILAPLLAALGLELPPGFGVAPSTLAYRAQTACAASAG